MSVKLKKGESHMWGRLEILTGDHVDQHEYVERLHALIGVLQQQDEEAYDHTRHYHILEILSDMMPTPEQAKKMFESEH